MKQKSTDIERSTSHGAGRLKGAGSRKVAAREPAAKASGQTPLEYMLAVMNDPQADLRRRDEIARTVAPYCHPRPDGPIAHRGPTQLPKRTNAPQSPAVGHTSSPPLTEAAQKNRAILRRYIAVWDSRPNGVTFPGLPNGDALAEQYVSLVRAMMAEDLCHGGPKE